MPPGVQSKRTDIGKPRKLKKGRPLAVRVVQMGGSFMKQNPAIKVAFWMILLLAVIWGLGFVFGYNGDVQPFSLG
ncbi:MAG: hypothetical protein K0R39_2233 [Symbiobacteriaceae bacterium]|nr:hypothetical protein [Symbiobacteriaceae bacterium]